jgi:hypothetical protein
MLPFADKMTRFLWSLFGASIIISVAVVLVIHLPLERSGVEESAGMEFGS